jgi:hypothetical protein
VQVDKKKFHALGKHLSETLARRAELSPKALLWNFNVSFLMHVLINDSDIPGTQKKAPFQAKPEAPLTFIFLCAILSLSSCFQLK